MANMIPDYRRHANFEISMLDGHGFTYVEAVNKTISGLRETANNCTRRAGENVSAWKRNELVDRAESASFVADELEAGG